MNVLQAVCLITLGLHFKLDFTMNDSHSANTFLQLHANTSNIGLAVSNIFLIFVTPFAVAIFLYLVHYNDILFRTLFVFGVLPILTPIINLIYVYVYDKIYNICLQQFFKCHCTNYEREKI